MAAQVGGNPWVPLGPDAAEPKGWTPETTSSRFHESTPYTGLLGQCSINVHGCTGSIQVGKVDVKAAKQFWKM